MNSFIGENACFIITDEAERFYFSGERVAEGVLVVSDCEKAYFTDMRYYESAVKKLGKKLKVYPETGDAIKKYIAEKGFVKIGLDYGKITVKEFSEYKKLKVKLFDCASAVAKMRSVKNDAEVENVKKACEITEKAFYETLPLLKVGITESEFKKELVASYLRYGAEKESFDTIVAFGKGSAIPHYETGDVKLTENCVVLVDTGCVYKGYCSDFTRTLYFGTPDKEFLSVYKAVLSANEIAERKIKEGTSLKTADGFARRILEKAGYGENFTHSLGHGVGVEIHEYPYLSPRAKGKIMEGNVFTVEPGAYFYGRFGVRIEDTVILNSGKVQRLFKDDKKLIVIKPR